MKGIESVAMPYIGCSERNSYLVWELSTVNGASNAIPNLLRCILETLTELDDCSRVVTATNGAVYTDVLDVFPI